MNNKEIGSAISVLLDAVDKVLVVADSLNKIEIKKSYNILYNLFSYIDKLGGGYNPNDMDLEIYLDQNSKLISMIQEFRAELKKITLWNSYKYRDRELIQQIIEMLDYVFRDVITDRLVDSGLRREKINLGELRCPLTMIMLVDYDIKNIVLNYMEFKNSHKAYF